MARARRGRDPYPWATSTDEDLLRTRLCDLGVDWRGTWLEDCVEQLHTTLARRGLRFRPHVWLSNEWFSPQGVPGVAMPFYLAHPRLRRLERTQMLEVEGGTRDGCLRVLKHECGHALQHAYRLHLRKRWRELFGSTSKEYPEFYRPNPASRRHVQHLRLYYAQSHPDEDFAETFAVWLGPRHRWRKRYAGWPALEKLEYLDTLLSEIADRPAPVRSRKHVDALRTQKQTLAEHYRDRRKRYPPETPDIYDRDLRQLFPDRSLDAERASAFLRRNRGEIRRLVSRWTGEYQFTLEQVLDDMISRCRTLDLRATGDDDHLRMEFAVLLAVKTMHYHYSRRNWFAL